MTVKRTQILSVLKKHGGTLSAKDIHTALLHRVDLVTIYRNLDVFVKEKVIKKIHLDTGEALYEYQHEPHHHAICSKCERVIHFTAPDKKIRKLLGIEDFDVESIEVTVRGFCVKDSKKKSNMQ